MFWVYSLNLDLSFDFWVSTCHHPRLTSFNKFKFCRPTKNSRNKNNNEQQRKDYWRSISIGLKNSFILITKKIRPMKKILKITVSNQSWASNATNKIPFSGIWSVFFDGFDNSDASDLASDSSHRYVHCFFNFLGPCSFLTKKNHQFAWVSNWWPWGRCRSSRNYRETRIT